MPFVKIDCGILNSTLWYERSAREVFLTALLMAEPFETADALPQLEVDSLTETGWVVPPGWYGFVPAAGIGILHRAGITDQEQGLEALRMLGSPESSSRSPEFDGRRLVRVNGGYVVLNFMKYRERDYTSAERSKRYRDRLASRRGVSKSRRDGRDGVTATVTRHRDITQAEAEAEAEAEKNNTKSAEPDGSRPTYLLYPLANRQLWHLKVAVVEQWQQSFSRIDVAAEAKKALLWLEANPAKRKTYKGMHKFLVGWMNRADERIVTTNMPSRAAADPQASYGWDCHHEPHCSGRWECARKEQIAALKHEVQP